MNGEVVALAEVYLREDEQNAETMAHRYGYLQSLMVEPTTPAVKGLAHNCSRPSKPGHVSKVPTELRLETWEFEQGAGKLLQATGLSYLAADIRA